MTGATLWTTLGMLGAAATLGAAGPLSQQPAKLDVPKVVAQLGLRPEAKAAIVPELNRVNDLLAQPTTTADQQAQVSRGLREVFSNIFPRLSPQQRATLHQALWNAGVPMGRMAGSGHMGDGMGSGMGSGAAWCLGNGTMGPGAGGMGSGGHMNGGHMNGGHMGWMGSWGQH